MLIQFFFDGACNNKQENPNMGIGIAVFVNNIYYEELSKFVGVKGDNVSSSNVAEWLGCIEAFKLAKEYFESGDKVEIYSDSQIITRQYNGDYLINFSHFKEFDRKAKKIAQEAGLGKVKIQWIKRELNKEADKLSKKGLKLINSDVLCS